MMAERAMNKRLTKAMQRIERHGGVVIVHHGDNGGNYFCTSDGSVVTGNVVRRLQEAGVLVSSNDGLFPAIPQTLRLKGA